MLIFDLLILKFFDAHTLPWNRYFWCADNDDVAQVFGGRVGAPKLGDF